MGQFNLYTTATTIDGANDLFLKYESSTGVLKTINRNTIMGVSGTPADISSSQSFTNKTIGNTNSITVKDGSFTLQNSSDTTKQAVFSLSGITTGNTRTLTIPDASGTLPLLGSTQTWTGANTFTGSSWSGGTIDNATLTVDSVAGHTTSTSGTIYGVGITTGQISGTNTVLPASLVTGIPTTKFSNACKFSVYLNAATNSANGSFAKVPYDTKLFDTGSNFDAVTNHRFTAPVTGFYHFNYSILCSVTSGSAFVTSLYKNGTENAGIRLQQGVSPSTAAQSSAASIEMSLSANDYIEVFFFGSGGAYSAGSTPIGVSFSGFLVSVT